MTTLKKSEESRLTDLIMVLQPYNKLSELRINSGNSLSAKVENEFLLEYEGAPIGVSEAGRHLAILGSMALAKDYNFSDAHYYLATHANLHRTSSKIGESDFLRLTVRTVFLEKRKGKVQGEISNQDGETIFTAEIEYKVLSKPVFSKLFSQHKTNETILNSVSPYVERKKLTHVVIGNDRASGLYGVVLAQECEGHFQDYPSLPVAIVGGLFIELGIQLFQKYTYLKFDQIIAINTSINAYRLAFSGEKVSFSVVIKKVISDDSIVFYGEASINGEVIANIEFELKGAL